MARVHEGLSGAKEIKKPANVVKVEICENSGKLAKGHCDEIDAYFKSGTQPVQFCNGHKYSGYDEDEDEEESPSPSPSASPELGEEGEDTEDDDTKSTLSPQKTSKPSTDSSDSNDKNEDKTENTSQTKPPAPPSNNSSGGIPQKVE